jgi:hypothetical protein
MIVGCATTTNNSGRNTTTNTTNTTNTTTDIEEGRRKNNNRRRKNNNKLLMFVFVAMVCFFVAVAVAVTVATDDDDEGNDNMTDRRTMTISSSKSNETFIQKFHVNNNRLFNDNEISTFEMLMQSQTAKLFITYYNDSNIGEICPQFTCTNDTLFNCVNETIQSSCTVMNRNYNGTAGYNNVEDISLHYMMSYTSDVCNVTIFPFIFQNRTSSHHDEILRDLHLLNLNSISSFERGQRLGRGKNNTADKIAN